MEYKKKEEWRETKREKDGEREREEYLERKN